MTVANVVAGGTISVSSDFWDVTERVPPSEFLGIFEQLDHAFEQTRRAATVDTAMIEAQCDLRFGLGNKLFLRFIPRRRFLSRAETEEQGLIGQGNRRAPFDPKRSEI